MPIARRPRPVRVRSNANANETHVRRTLTWSLMLGCDKGVGQFPVSGLRTEGGRVRRSTLLFRVMFVCSLALAFDSVSARPASAGVASSGLSSNSLCGEIKEAVTLPAPPPGLVATETWAVNENCQIELGPVQFVDPSMIGPIPGDALIGLGSVRQSPNSGESVLSTSNAYAVQRTWDCCGIKMNEYYLDVQWSPSTAGSKITSWSAWDGASWHLEANGKGWHLDAPNHFLGASAGGVGNPSVTVHGHQGFKYDGIFDPTGTVFYNTYDTWLEGKPGFTYGQCTLQVVWRHAAVGWHQQQWCSPGTYP